MANAPVKREGEDPQGQKPRTPDSPPPQEQQGGKRPPVKRGERPIADVDRKVRGGDA